MDADDAEGDADATAAEGGAVESSADAAKRILREEKLLAQVEFYLSDENLKTDEYLRFAMAATPEESVKLNTLCSFNKMKKLKASVKRLSELLANHPTLVLNETKKAVFRRSVLLCVLCPVWPFSTPAPCWWACRGGCEY